jgi:hypothetical protein
MAVRPSRSLATPRARRPVTRLLALSLLALGVALSMPAAHADDDPVGIARVTGTRGDVRLLRDGEAIDSGDSRGLRARSVDAGDRLQTGWNARAEIAVGPDRLRLDEDTALLVRRLDTRRIAITLERGRVALLVRHDDNARLWQIDTAAGSHRPLGAGLFRIDAPPPRQAPAGASATAWRQALRIEVDAGTLTLPPGRRIELDRFGEWQTGLPASDEFARWAMTDARDDDGPALRVAPVAPAIPAAPVELPPDLVDADSLARHGRWELSAEWGWLWLPTIRVDWAPFRHGRWVRLGSGGWMWLDEAPWGRTTYQHGRWIAWNDRWGWLPGPAVQYAEPVAPRWEMPMPPPRVIRTPPPMVIETPPAPPPRRWSPPAEPRWQAPPPPAPRPPDRRYHEPAPWTTPTPAPAPGPAQPAPRPADPREEPRRPQRNL